MDPTQTHAKWTVHSGSFHVRAGAKRAAMMVGHQKGERDDDEGGNWSEEGRHLMATAITTEMFVDRKAGYQPIHVSDVFHAKTTLFPILSALRRTSLGRKSRGPGPIAT